MAKQPRWMQLSFDVDRLRVGATEWEIIRPQSFRFILAQIGEMFRDIERVLDKIRDVLGTDGTLDHGELSGLDDQEDHPDYVTRDGTREMTANWDAGGYEIRSLTFESDVATGTAPLTIASTTVVSNLNADYVDGKHASDLYAFNTVTGDAGSTTANANPDTLTVAGGTGISTAVAGDTLTITNSSPASGSLIFKTISCPAGTNPVADAVDDTLSLLGTNVTITGDATADSVTFAVHAPGSDDQNIFQTVSCPAGTSPVADTTTDTLTLTGTNVTITGDSGTDTVNFAVHAPNSDDQNIFQTVSCPAGTSPVADTTTDTLTLANGANISITGDSATDTVTIAATGLPLVAFKTISCTAGTSPVADATDDTLSIAAGTGISVTGDEATDTVTIANTGATVAFKTIDCPAGTDPVADAADDTLTLAATGSGTVTGDSAADSITFHFKSVPGCELLRTYPSATVAAGGTPIAYTTIGVAGAYSGTVVQGGMVDLSVGSHRLSVYGSRTAGAGTIDVRIYDLTNSQTLASVSMNAAAQFWTDTTFANLPTGDALVVFQYAVSANTSGTVTGASWYWYQT